MCGNIKTLYSFAQPGSTDDIRAAAVKFVRKVSGWGKPSNANTDTCDRAVDEVSVVVQRLLDSLVTAVPSKNRKIDAAKARERFERSRVN